MGRVAVRFAYDGSRFMGSQRQPRERTAESELLSALMRAGAITSADDNRFRVASRTDRGVSALGNVFAVNTEFRRDELLAAINASCHDVHCYALAEVADDFSPRRAKGRWYRYHLPYRGQDLQLMSECALEFEGEHEFRSFCKPDGKVTRRRLESVEVRRDGGPIIIDLRAREFLRNMVRRIVAALDQVGMGKASLVEVRAALNGQGGCFGLAEPEGLFLMEVEHDLEWTYPRTGPMAARVDEEAHRAQVRHLFFRELQEKTGLASSSSGK